MVIIAIFENLYLAR